MLNFLRFFGRKPLIAVIPVIPVTAVTDEESRQNREDENDPGKVVNGENLVTKMMTPNVSSARWTKNSR